MAVRGFPTLIHLHLRDMHTPSAKLKSVNRSPARFQYTTRRIRPGWHCNKPDHDGHASRQSICTFLGTCKQHRSGYVVPIPVEGEWRREIGGECLPPTSRLPADYHCSDYTSGSVWLLVPSRHLPCLHHSCSFFHHSIKRHMSFPKVQVDRVQSSSL